MSSADPQHVVVSSRVAALHARYEEAQAARLRWAQEANSLREALLAALDYTEDDPKPVPVVAVDVNDHPLFEIRIGTWRGPDVRWIKEQHPDVWALAERTKPTKTIRGLS